MPQSRSKRKSRFDLMIGITQANTDVRIAAAKELFQEYSESLEFDLCFQNFDEEMGVTPIEESSEEEIKEEVDIVKEDQSSDSDEPATTLSLEEKVMKIIAQNPEWGSSQIAKELFTEQYGHIKIGKLAVWKLLRQLNLNSKKERIAFSQKGGVE